MHDFHGWSAGVLWEGVKFDWKHYGDIERLAIVGEKSGKQEWYSFADHSQRHDPIRRYFRNRRGSALDNSWRRKSWSNLITQFLQTSGSFLPT